MIIPWAQFNTALQNAPDSVQELFANNQLLKQAEVIVTDHNLQPDTMPKMVMFLSDVALSLRKPADLHEDLIDTFSVKPDQAESIIITMQKYKDTLVATKNISVEPITSTPVPPPVQENVAVQPLRTMEGDVDKMHGYGAYRDLYPDAVAADNHSEEPLHTTSQADVLARPQLAPTPTYTPQTEVTNDEQPPATEPERHV